ncbi:uncharacterized protein [Clytia hemisphaerica]|uniref:uncharacterized protein n=1 Tax=Clytia hemisphaerica TaxID=252671 RepID=UPI0034D7A363
MNEAHSSVDRERTIHEGNRKLKQENAELRVKYEKETLENKIKILEMQNEIQTLKHGNEIAKLKAKQEKNEEKVGVSLTENALKEENQALKNEIQTLKHDNEIAKLKAQQENKNNGSQMAKEIEALKIQNQAFEKKVAEADLINEFEDLKQEMGGLKAQNGKLKNDFQALENKMGGLKAQNGKLEKEVQALENEMSGLKTQNGKLEKEVEDLKNGIEGLKVELKDQMQTQKGKLENEVQALRNDFEHLKTDFNRRFFEGAEKFLLNYNTGREDFFGDDYKLWYEDMSRSMENRKQYVDQKFVLIRKGVKRYRKELFFGPKAKGVQYNEKDFDLIVEGLEKKLPKNGKLSKMNEAHSSADRERTIHEEHRKLKQENAELRAKYEKETLENKIKILEMQNEIQTLKHGNEIDKLKAKQEKNEEKVVVSLTENALKEENQALKNEIQTLKYDNEIAKLKAQQENKNNGSQMAKEIETLKIQNQALEKTVAEADLKNEFEALKQEMGGLKAQNGKLEKDFQTLENEMGGLKAQNGELEKEVQALKNGIDGLKVELKDQMQTQKGKLENEVQALRNDFEYLKTGVNQKQEIEGAQKAVQEKVRKPLGKIPDRFFEGAEKFWMDYNTGREDFIGENYKLWYEDMSRLMENRKQYVNQKFVLIRKDVAKEYHQFLYFGSKAKDVKYNERDDDLIVEGLEKRLPKNTNVFLLHPNDSKKCSKMKFHGRSQLWRYKNVPQDYYFGGGNSVIMLAQIGVKNDVPFSYKDKIKMNEAHSSVDRERTIHEEHRKLKQENAELRVKYEKETLENKIKTLEMQNEIQTLKHDNEIAKLKAKQEKNEEKVVVSLTENSLKEENQALKNEIQTLKHDNEIVKLKAQQENKNNGGQMAKEIETLKIQNQALEKTVAEADLKNEFEALKQNLGGLKAQNGKLENDFQALENEMGSLKAQNGKLEKKVQVLKNGIEGLKVELKDQTQTQKGKLENEVQALRNDFEHLKTEVNQKQEIEGAEKAVQEKVQKPLGNIPDRFFEGAERFLVNYNTGRGDFVGKNYKLWYEDMSRSMENGKQYVDQKFVLICKDVKKYHEHLFFGSKAKDCKYDEQDFDLIVEGLEKRLPRNANVFLLHPNDLKKCSKMEFYGRSLKVNWWRYENIPQDYYFGGESIY